MSCAILRRRGRELRPLLIVKTGATLPELACRLGDFEDWISDTLGAARSQTLTAEGNDPVAILDSIEETPWGRKIMRRVRDLVDQTTAERVEGVSVSA